MEVPKKFKHPDQDRVKDLIKELLDESRRRIAIWHLEMLDYDYYTGSYRIKLMLNEHSAVAHVPSEWVDEIWQTNDKFKRRRVKRALKNAVEDFWELEDE